MSAAVALLMLALAGPPADVGAIASWEACTADKRCEPFTQGFRTMAQCQSGFQMVEADFMNQNPVFTTVSGWQCRPANQTPA